MCKHEGKPYSLIEYQELPNKMTLEKTATFNKQTTLLKYIPKVKQTDGMKRVMNAVKIRLKNENISSNTI